MTGNGISQFHPYVLIQYQERGRMVATIIRLSEEKREEKGFFSCENQFTFEFD